MHIPVLLGETISALNLKEGSVVADVTFGNGGHSEKIFEKIGPEGKIVAFDIDPIAIENAKKKFAKELEKGRLVLANENFSDFKKTIEKLNFKKVDAVLADLGWRMEQFENPDYGLSFSVDGPLDMRLGGKEDLTAYEIVNRWNERALEDIFKKYGEERYAPAAVKAIVEERKVKKISTTFELKDILEKVLSRYYRNLKINPATKVFQAIRIAVNNELANLRNFLPQALEVLEPKGRLAVIAFHSLEDRIVKNFFQVNARGCVCPKELPVCICGQKPKLKIVSKKPVIASDEEVRKNPRSRSAKLRIAEKL